MIMSRKAIHHLCRADQTLARLIKKVGPCALKVGRRRTPFEALVRAVVHQQLNGTAAKTILSRVLSLYPAGHFPSPEEMLATPEEQLRGAGLSRAKTAAVKDLAAKTIAGVVPGGRAIARLDDAKIMERLTCVRGIGPWTVEMLLIFTLGRPDVLPATDYGVRKGFALTYGRRDLPAPKELLDYGERWRPHRSIAAWYLWRSLELPP